MMRNNYQGYDRKKDWRLRENEMGEKLKRQAKIIGAIAVGCTKMVLQEEKTYAVAGGVALIQGLKYNGSVKRGVKAGTATVGVMVGVSTIQHIAINWDVIKNA